MEMEETVSLVAKILANLGALNVGLSVIGFGFLGFIPGIIGQIVAVLIGLSAVYLFIKMAMKMSK